MIKGFILFIKNKPGLYFINYFIELRKPRSVYFFKFWIRYLRKGEISFFVKKKLNWNNLG